MENGTPQILPLEKLQPHPQNPRLLLREEVVNGIVTQLKATGEFSIMHAPIVRPVNSHYEIVAGHHRHEAAKRAGLTAIPCWVAEPTDEEAFMQLVLSNAQSELSPLEIGIHALEYVKLGTGGQGQKGGLSAYAEKIGKSHSYVVHVRQAAEVLKTLQSVSWGTVLLDKAKHLAAIHSAPQDIWHLLVEALLANSWTVDDTEKAVKRVKDLLTAIPDWWTVDRLSVLERDEPGAATCITTCVWHFMWHVYDVESDITLYHFLTQKSPLPREKPGRAGILYRSLSHSV